MAKFPLEVQLGQSWFSFSEGTDEGLGFLQVNRSFKRVPRC